MSPSTTHSETSPVTPPEVIRRLFQAEDRHFWFRGRNRVLARVVGQLVEQLEPGYRVLEVGCGTGNVLRVLEEVCHSGEVIGLDLNEDRLPYARQRVRCPVVQGDLHDLSFEKPFHLIGMFDVLEHLPDARRALQDIATAIIPGGALVLTVPAHRSLWSYTDTHAGHYLRYNKNKLIATLESAGFTVEYVTEFMAVLYPLMWLGRRLASLRYRAGTNVDEDRARALRELRIVPGLNAFLTWLLISEIPWITHRLTLPVGASLLAIGRKRAA